MLKFLALSSSCKKFCGYPNGGLSLLQKLEKSAGKPDAEWLVRERIVKSNPEKSLGITFLFSPGPELNQNEQVVSPPF